MERTEIYKLIDGEREYQEARWPSLYHDHSATEYLVYIRDYTEEALHRVSRDWDESFALENMRKIAALAVACMERHGSPGRLSRQ